MRWEIDPGSYFGGVKDLIVLVEVDEVVREHPRDERWGGDREKPEAGLRPESESANQLIEKLQWLMGAVSHPESGIQESSSSQVVDGEDSGVHNSTVPRAGTTLISIGSLNTDQQEACRR